MSQAHGPLLNFVKVMENHGNCEADFPSIIYGSFNKCLGKKI